MVDLARRGAMILALAVACTAAPTGCSGDGAGDPPTNGTLTGRALQYGGPLVNNSPAANGIPDKGVLVTIRQGEKIIASARSGDDGGFSFHLAAGSYTISGCQSIDVVIRPGEETRQDLICPVP